MRDMIVRTALAATGLLGAMCVASAAQATTSYTITGFSVPFRVDGKIHAPSLNPAGEAAQIGQIHFITSVPGVTLDVFCIDVDDILTTGTFDGYDVNTATDPGNTIETLGYTTTELANVGYLLSHFGAASTGNAVKSAALQLAIWEVLNETDSSWNVKTGAFYVTNYNADLAAVGGVDDTATTYLTSLSTAPVVGDYTMTVLQPHNPGPGHNQTQVFGLVGGVPEPATWGMIVVGFGLLGSALRRRKPEDVFA
jgi:hypothetical protein